MSWKLNLDNTKLRRQFNIRCLLLLTRLLSCMRRGFAGKSTHLFYNYYFRRKELQTASSSTRNNGILKGTENDILRVLQNSSNSHKTKRRISKLIPRVGKKKERCNKAKKYSSFSNINTNARYNRYSHEEVMFDPKTPTPTKKGGFAKLIPPSTAANKAAGPKHKTKSAYDTLYFSPAKTPLPSKANSTRLDNCIDVYVSSMERRKKERDSRPKPWRVNNRTTAKMTTPKGSNPNTPIATSSFNKAFKTPQRSASTETRSRSGQASQRQPISQPRKSQRSMQSQSGQGAAKRRLQSPSVTVVEKEVPKATVNIYKEAYLLACNTDRKVKNQSSHDCDHSILTTDTTIRAGLKSDDSESYAQFVTRNKINSKTFIIPSSREELSLDGFEASHAANRGKRSPKRRTSSAHDVGYEDLTEKCDARTENTHDSTQMKETIVDRTVSIENRGVHKEKSQICLHTAEDKFSLKFSPATMSRDNPPNGTRAENFSNENLPSRGSRRYKRDNAVRGMGQEKNILKTSVSPNEVVNSLKEIGPTKERKLSREDNQRTQTIQAVDVTPMKENSVNKRKVAPKGDKKFPRGVLANCAPRDTRHVTDACASRENRRHHLAVCSSDENFQGVQKDSEPPSPKSTEEPTISLRLKDINDFAKARAMMNAYTQFLQMEKLKCKNVMQDLDADYLAATKTFNLQNLEEDDTGEIVSYNKKCVGEFICSQDASLLTHCVDTKDTMKKTGEVVEADNTQSGRKPKRSKQQTDCSAAISIPLLEKPQEKRASTKFTENIGHLTLTTNSEDSDKKLMTRSDPLNFPHSCDQTRIWNYKPDHAHVGKIGRTIIRHSMPSLFLKANHDVGKRVQTIVDSYSKFLLKEKQKTESDSKDEGSTYRSPLYRSPTRTPPAQRANDNSESVRPASRKWPEVKMPEATESSGKPEDVAEYTCSDVTNFTKYLETNSIADGSYDVADEIPFSAEKHRDGIPPRKSTDRALTPSRIPRLTSLHSRTASKASESLCWRGQRVMTSRADEDEYDAVTDTSSSQRMEHFAQVMSVEGVVSTKRPVDKALAEGESDEDDDGSSWTATLCIGTSNDECVSCTEERHTREMTQNAGIYFVDETNHEPNSVVACGEEFSETNDTTIEETAQVGDVAGKSGNFRGGSASCQNVKTLIQQKQFKHSPVHDLCGDSYVLDCFPSEIEGKRSRMGGNYKVETYNCDKRRPTGDKHSLRKDDMGKPKSTQHKHERLQFENRVNENTPTSSKLEVICERNSKGSKKRGSQVDGERMNVNLVREKDIKHSKSIVKVETDKLKATHGGRNGSKANQVAVPNVSSFTSCHSYKSSSSGQNNSISTDRSFRSSISFNWLRSNGDVRDSFDVSVNDTQTPLDNQKRSNRRTQTLKETDLGSVKNESNRDNQIAMSNGTVDEKLHTDGGDELVCSEGAHESGVENISKGSCRILPEDSHHQPDKHQPDTKHPMTYMDIYRMSKQIAQTKEHTGDSEPFSPPTTSLVNEKKTKDCPGRGSKSSSKVFSSKSKRVTTRDSESSSVLRAHITRGATPRKRTLSPMSRHRVYQSTSDASVINELRIASEKDELMERISTITDTQSLKETKREDRSMTEDNLIFSVNSIRNIIEWGDPSINALSHSPPKDTSEYSTPPVKTSISFTCSSSKTDPSLDSFLSNAFTHSIASKEETPIQPLEKLSARPKCDFLRNKVSMSKEQTVILRSSIEQESKKPVASLNKFSGSVCTKRTERRVRFSPMLVRDIDTDSDEDTRALVDSITSSWGDESTDINHDISTDNSTTMDENQLTKQKQWPKLITDLLFKPSHSTTQSSTRPQKVKSKCTFETSKFIPCETQNTENAKNDEEESSSKDPCPSDQSSESTMRNIPDLEGIVTTETSTFSHQSKMDSEASLILVNAEQREYLHAHRTNLQTRDYNYSNKTLGVSSSEPCLSSDPEENIRSLMELDDDCSLTKSVSDTFVFSAYITGILGVLQKMKEGRKRNKALKSKAEKMMSDLTNGKSKKTHGLGDIYDKERRSKNKDRSKTVITQTKEIQQARPKDHIKKEKQTDMKKSIKDKTADLDKAETNSFFSLHSDKSSSKSAAEANQKTSSSSSVSRVSPRFLPGFNKMLSFWESQFGILTCSSRKQTRSKKVKKTPKPYQKQNLHASMVDQYEYSPMTSRNASHWDNLTGLSENPVIGNMLKRVTGQSGEENAGSGRTEENTGSAIAKREQRTVGNASPPTKEQGVANFNMTENDGDSNDVVWWTKRSEKGSSSAIVLSPRKSKGNRRESSRVTTSHGDHVAITAFGDGDGQNFESKPKNAVGHTKKRPRSKACIELDDNVLPVDMETGISSPKNAMRLEEDTAKARKDHETIQDGCKALVSETRDSIHTFVSCISQANAMTTPSRHNRQQQQGHFPTQPPQSKRKLVKFDDSEDEETCFRISSGLDTSPVGKINIIAPPVLSSSVESRFLNDGKKLDAFELEHVRGQHDESVLNSMSSFRPGFLSRDPRSEQLCKSPAQATGLCDRVTNLRRDRDTAKDLIKAIKMNKYVARLIKASVLDDRMGLNSTNAKLCQQSQPSSKSVDKVSVGIQYEYSRMNASGYSECTKNSPPSECNALFNERSPAPNVENGLVVNRYTRDISKTTNSLSDKTTTNHIHSLRVGESPGNLKPKHLPDGIPRYSKQKQSPRKIQRRLTQNIRSGPHNAPQFASVSQSPSTITGGVRDSDARRCLKMDRNKKERNKEKKLKLIRKENENTPSQFDNLGSPVVDHPMMTEEKCNFEILEQENFRKTAGDEIKLKHYVKKSKSSEKQSKSSNKIRSNSEHSFEEENCDRYSSTDMESDMAKCDKAEKPVRKSRSHLKVMKGVEVIVPANREMNKKSVKLDMHRGGGPEDDKKHHQCKSSTYRQRIVGVSKSSDCSPKKDCADTFITPSPEHAVSNSTDSEIDCLSPNSKANKKAAVDIKRFKSFQLKKNGRKTELCQKQERLVGCRRYKHLREEGPGLTFLKAREERSKLPENGAENHKKGIANICWNDSPKQTDDISELSWSDFPVMSTKSHNCHSNPRTEQTCLKGNMCSDRGTCGLESVLEKSDALIEVCNPTNKKPPIAQPASLLKHVLKEENRIWNQPVQTEKTKKAGDQQSTQKHPTTRGLGKNGVEIVLGSEIPVSNFVASLLKGIPGSSMKDHVVQSIDPNVPPQKKVMITLSPEKPVYKRPKREDPLEQKKDIYSKRANSSHPAGDVKVKDENVQLVKKKKNDDAFNDALRVMAPCSFPIKDKAVSANLFSDSVTNRRQVELTFTDVKTSKKTKIYVEPDVKDEVAWPQLVSKNGFVFVTFKQEKPQEARKANHGPSKSVLETSRWMEIKAGNRNNQYATEIIREDKLGDLSLHPTSFVNHRHPHKAKANSNPKKAQCISWCTQPPEAKNRRDNNVEGRILPPEKGPDEELLMPRPQQPGKVIRDAWQQETFDSRVMPPYPTTHATFDREAHFNFPRHENMSPVRPIEPSIQNTKVYQLAFEKNSDRLTYLKARPGSFLAKIKNSSTSPIAFGAVQESRKLHMSTPSFHQGHAIGNYSRNRSDTPTHTKHQYRERQNNESYFTPAPKRTTFVERIHTSTSPCLFPYTPESKTRTVQAKECKLERSQKKNQTQNCKDLKRVYDSTHLNSKRNQNTSASPSRDTSSLHSTVDTSTSPFISSCSKRQTLSFNTKTGKQNESKSASSDSAPLKENKSTSPCCKESPVPITNHEFKEIINQLLRNYSGKFTRPPPEQSSNSEQENENSSSGLTTSEWNGDSESTQDKQAIEFQKKQMRQYKESQTMTPSVPHRDYHPYHSDMTGKFQERVVNGTHARVFFQSDLSQNKYDTNLNRTNTVSELRYLIEKGSGVTRGEQEDKQNLQLRKHLLEHQASTENRLQQYESMLERMKNRFENLDLYKEKKSCADCVPEGLEIGQDWDTRRGGGEGAEIHDARVSPVRVQDSKSVFQPKRSDTPQEYKPTQERDIQAQFVDAGKRLDNKENVVRDPWNGGDWLRDTHLLHMELNQDTVAYGAMHNKETRLHNQRLHKEGKLLNLTPYQETHSFKDRPREEETILNFTPIQEIHSLNSRPQREGHFLNSTPNQDTLPCRLQKEVDPLHVTLNHGKQSFDDRLHQDRYTPNSTPKKDTQMFSNRLHKEEKTLKFTPNQEMLSINRKIHQDTYRSDRTPNQVMDSFNNGLHKEGKFFNLAPNKQTHSFWDRPQERRAKSSNGNSQELYLSHPMSNQDNHSFNNKPSQDRHFPNRTPDRDASASATRSYKKTQINVQAQDTHNSPGNPIKREDSGYVTPKTNYNPILSANPNFPTSSSPWTRNVTDIWHTSKRVGDPSPKFPAQQRVENNTSPTPKMRRGSITPFQWRANNVKTVMKKSLLETAQVNYTQGIPQKQPKRKVGIFRHFHQNHSFSTEADGSSNNGDANTISNKQPKQKLHADDVKKSLGNMLDNGGRVSKFRISSKSSLGDIEGRRQKISQELASRLQQQHQPQQQRQQKQGKQQNYSITSRGSSVGDGRSRKSGSGSSLKSLHETQTSRPGSGSWLGFGVDIDWDSVAEDEDEIRLSTVKNVSERSQFSKLSDQRAQRISRAPSLIDSDQRRMSNDSLDWQWNEFQSHDGTLSYRSTAQSHDRNTPTRPSSQYGYVTTTPTNVRTSHRYASTPTSTSRDRSGTRSGSSRSGSPRRVKFKSKDIEEDEEREEDESRLGEMGNAPEQKKKFSVKDLMQYKFHRRVIGLPSYLRLDNDNKDDYAEREEGCSSHGRCEPIKRVQVTTWDMEILNRLKDRQIQPGTVSMIQTQY